MPKHPAALTGGAETRCRNSDSGMKSMACLLFVVVLAGCKTAPPERIVVPEIVKVPVREYVAIPDKLTEPCVSPEIASRTVEAVVSVANDRKVCEDRLNSQLRQIRKLGQP